MGGASSKGGAAAGRAAKSIAKAGVTGKLGKPSPPQGSHLPVDDDLLANFKPDKVVEMSRPEAQAAAKKMYDEEVPDMNPDILRQAIALGPVGKAELTHQKLVPDASEVVANENPRPLPKDRTRAVAKSSEVDAEEGLLTQTQLAAFLGRCIAGSGASAPAPAASLLDEFHVSKEDAEVLLRYYRAPDIRMYEDTMTARWHWPTSGDGDGGVRRGR
ncbi:unnamed protein product [Scytosiphon promiscuus]